MQYAAKQLVADGCVLSVQNNEGISSIEVFAGAGICYTTVAIQIGEIKMSNRTMWFFVGGVLVGVLALAGIGGAVAAMSGAFGARGTVESVSQGTTTFGVTHVFIQQEAYSPPRIQVLLSTTVTWTNKDKVPHNVTITPVVVSAADTWESGQLYPGQSFSYTFASRGTFKYYCQDHPEMVGTVTVT